MLTNKKAVEKNIESFAAVQKSEISNSSKIQSANEASTEKIASLVRHIISDAAETTRILSQSIYMQMP